MMRARRSTARDPVPRAVALLRVPRAGAVTLAVWLTVATVAMTTARAATPASASDSLAAIDARLAQNPKDPQLQFRRGVALSAAGRTADAITTFKRLIDEHPELAAAYNNLAALQADQGDDEAARALLQKAVQLKPGYATALHNLGDVHLRLAAAAYTQAATADPSDALARSRIGALRSWMDDRAATAAPTAAAPIQLAAASSVPARQASAASAGAKAASAPVGPASATNDSSIADVTAIVRNWADDWSRRDAAAYVGYYAPDFKGHAADHAAWQADRTTKLTRPRRITVTVDQLVVSVIGSNATARFRQTYNADTMNSVDRKTLSLVRNPAGRWLITGEAVDK